MKLVIFLFCCLLSTLSSAEPTESTTETEALTQQECIQAVEQCATQEPITRCKFNMENAGCTFDANQPFTPKEHAALSTMTPLTEYNQEECILAVKNCPIYELCKEGLNQMNCHLTPKDLNLSPNPEIIAEFLKESIDKTLFKPTPENCKGLHQECSRYVENNAHPACQKLVLSMGCPS